MTRVLPLRRLAAATAPVLLVAALAGCGGGASGAPDDASKEDFCELLVDFVPDLPDDIGERSEDEQVDAVSDGLDQVEEKAEETGTPEDIPDDAREGFELTLEQVGEISDDDLRDALENDEDPFEGQFSGEEQEKVDAYQEWSEEYCA